VGDLGVAGFVGADQAQAVSADQWGLAIEEEKEGEAEEDGSFAGAGPTGKALAPACGQIRNGWILRSFHFQRFSNMQALRMQALRKPAVHALAGAIRGGLTGLGYGPRFTETRDRAAHRQG